MMKDYFVADPSSSSSSNSNLEKRPDHPFFSSLSNKIRPKKKKKSPKKTESTNKSKSAKFPRRPFRKQGAVNGSDSDSPSWD